MTITYLSKAVTLPATGIIASAWVITNAQIQFNNADLSKTEFNIGVSGYVSADALSSGLRAVPGARYNYRLTAENFPSNTDLSAITQTQLYAALDTYITNTTTDPLCGAAVVTT